MMRSSGRNVKARDSTKTPLLFLILHVVLLFSTNERQPPQTACFGVPLAKHTDRRRAEHLDITAYTGGIESARDVHT